MHQQFDNYLFQVYHWTNRKTYIRYDIVCYLRIRLHFAFIHKFLFPQYSVIGNLFEKFYTSMRHSTMIADKDKKITCACLKKISSFSAMNKKDCYVFLYKSQPEKVHVDTYCWPLRSSIRWSQTRTTRISL